MSAQPPPPSGPIFSPDGRYYWDGTRWVPRDPPPPPGQSGRPSNTGPVVAVSVIVVVLVLGAIWYFGFYDTAAGKCNRGDVGACLVVAAQQAAVQASAEASQAAV